VSAHRDGVELIPIQKCVAFNDSLTCEVIRFGEWGYLLLATSNILKSLRLLLGERRPAMETTRYVS
jgi:hypothetical protein